MESSLLHDLVSVDMSTAPLTTGKRFSPVNLTLNDRMLRSLISRFADDPAQSNRVRSLQNAMAEANQKIEHLAACNAKLQHQLEQAWQRESDAVANAHMDELTGLPNRRLFKDRLVTAIAHADRHARSVAVLLIDMDDFKMINDTFGHSAGDQLLCQVAQRLGKCLRAVDTACRYGGDEFVMIFSELAGAEAVDAVFNKVRECLLPPYLISGREMTVSASIGKSLYPMQANNDLDLINRADADMYKIKAQRKPRR